MKMTANVGFEKEKEKMFFFQEFLKKTIKDSRVQQFWHH